MSVVLLVTEPAQTGAGLAAAPDGPLVVLAATCAPVAELAPRLSDDPDLRAAADAAGATVLELADLVRGQHPLGWERADLTADAPALRAALGDVDTLLSAPGADATQVAAVLRDALPGARVLTWDASGAGTGAGAARLTELPAPPPAPVRRAPGTGTRAWRAARLRLWEARVIARAALDVRRRRDG